jgi:cellulose biosynthesis protein BcsQ
MSIITIGTTKGGAGKTTRARLIVGRFALSGQKAAARAFAAVEIDRTELMRRISR